MLYLQPKNNTVNKIHSVGKEIFWIDNLVAVPPYACTFDLNMIVAVVCTRGRAGVRLNRKPYRLQAPGITISRPGEILQYEQVSADFTGYLVLMTGPFAGGLLTDVRERFSLRQALADTPCLPLNSRALQTASDYCALLQKTRTVEAHSVRREIVRHLTLAFYHTLAYEMQWHPSVAARRSTAHHLSDRFIELVQEHFREHRNIGYYADRLCLTPRYLSKVVRDGSGASAGEWIDNTVILEAKEQLRNTGRTIQQISDRLNFPSSSFFGKYFKRIVGVSPQRYRKG
jgi:AraC-like DNA-binding protein